ncbi:hypothetical protein EST38_g3779 [Candolleomyces aberdarensis]|uniref:Uncharacterized protein n=1 Tax=Candolleomyces aberdarensis TaxID=2316362 RepID=A0A4Q2DP22_9AGAR|nr:hypothetical protein EST38_g3779 [Candolleomyces aberdarensis]
MVLYLRMDEVDIRTSELGGKERDSGVKRFRNEPPLKEADYAAEPACGALVWPKSPSRTCRDAPL